ncbi:MAG: M48 family metalloprotease [Alphaproteobacteria bacterium]
MKQFFNIAAASITITTTLMAGTLQAEGQSPIILPPLPSDSSVAPASYQTPADELKAAEGIQYSADNGITMVDKRTGDDVADPTINAMINRLPHIMEQLMQGTNSFPDSTVTPPSFDLHQLTVEIRSEKGQGAWHDPLFSAATPKFGMHAKLLKLLTEQQLAAVFAHEYAHWEITGKAGAKIIDVEVLKKDNDNSGVDARFDTQSSKMVGTVKFADGSQISQAANERNADLSTIRRLYEAGYPPESLVLFFKKMEDINGSDTPNPIPLTPQDMLTPLGGFPVPQGWNIVRVNQVMQTLTAFCETIENSPNLPPCAASTMNFIESWKIAREEDTKAKAWEFTGTTKWFERVNADSGEIRPVATITVPINTLPRPKLLKNTP